MVDVRAQQGYSVWKGETFVVNGQQGGHSGDISNAGGSAWGAGGMYGELRPEFWAAIDDIMAYINAKGLVVSFAFAGIGRGLTEASMEMPISALARYCVGRYAAYHTVWTTCQEYCSGTPFPDAWARIAQLQWELDPHKRSTSLHNCASNPIPAWRAEPWYGHVTLQQGHFMTSSVRHWLDQYNTDPPRVVIEDEANYENLKYASMTTNVPGWLTRQSAWQSQIGGATGFTYGGQGIWWACYNRTYVNGNCGRNDPPGLPPTQSGYFTWDQGLDFAVGGHQIPAMATFFRQLPWHTLAPNASSIAWSSEAPNGTQRPYQKSDQAGNYVVAYLPRANGNPHSGGPSGCRPSGRNSSSYGGTIQGINPHIAHTVSWFNPRTAEYTVVGTIAGGDSTFTIPTDRPRDADDDWVLLVKPTTALLHRENGAARIQEAPTGTSWVTSVQLHGRVRSAPSEIGCAFRAVGTLNVTHLCRLPVGGSRNVQMVTVYTAAGAVVTSAHVDALDAKTVDKLGFVCTPVPTSTATTLHDGTSYFITLTTIGCDGWYDDTGTTVSVVGGTTAAVKSVYGHPPNVNPGGGGVGHCYGPLNFYYSG